MDVKEVPKSKYLPQSIDAILENFAIIYDGVTFLLYFLLFSNISEGNSLQKILPFF